MKSVSLLVSAGFVLSAALANATIICESTAKKNEATPFSDYMETKTFEISEISSKSIVINFKPNGKFVGSFSKIARNGASVYECGELTDIADQTDLGNILVSQKLLQKHSGTLTLSTRQLGDSEGSSWINETFSCEPK